MSIFKDTFRGYVRDQLTLREGLIGFGNDGVEGINNRRSRNSVSLPSSGESITLPEDSYYQYTLNKQCGIRLTSLVDYVEDVGLELGDLDDFNALRDEKLSKRFILEGGVLSRTTLRGGINSTESNPQRS